MVTLTQRWSALAPLESFQRQFDELLRAILGDKALHDLNDSPTDWPTDVASEN